ncbi:MAG: amidohydrolase family protein [Acidobacteriota bacterium]
MKVMHKLLPTLVLALCSIPGGRAQGTFAIKDAKIVTVAGDTIPRGTVLIQDGVITAVGAKVSIPSRARVIRARNLTVYPGLFDANTQLGLTEIGQVAVTNDFNEMGDYTPQLMAFTAFHVESEHLPVARVDGITHVLTRPSGGVIPGQAAVMSLAGWDQEEMEIRRHGAMMLNFPSLLPLRRGFFGPRSRPRPYAEQKKEFEKKRGQLKELLAKVRHYKKAKEAGVSVTFNKQLEALIPVVTGELPVLIQADSHVDIKEAVQFAGKEGLNYVLLGAADAWKVADFLKENEVRVILGPTQRLPLREDDPIDIFYRTPAILHQKGVRFAIATGGAANARTLAFEVGNAVAYGLPYDVALRSITLTPAEFLGLSDQVGSIEKGKKANLVVADGDILEYQTRVRHVFINGAPISLESKHTRLYRKYINRP